MVWNSRAGDNLTRGVARIGLLADDEFEHVTFARVADEGKQASRLADGEYQHAARSRIERAPMTDSHAPGKPLHPITERCGARPRWFKRVDETEGRAQPRGRSASISARTAVSMRSSASASGPTSVAPAARKCPPPPSARAASITLTRPRDRKLKR